MIELYCEPYASPRSSLKKYYCLNFKFTSSRPHLVGGVIPLSCHQVLNLVLNYYFGADGRTRALENIIFLLFLLLQTTKEDWFDLTCSGHDPGKGRPGVPYEISRCCFFHLGNVLLDDEITDQWAVNKLTELKRTIECKTQIGKC